MSEFHGKNIDHEHNRQSESKIEDETDFDNVDLSVLLSFADVQCEGEGDLIVELIDLYLGDVPQRLSVMKDCVLNADEISLKRAAHTLKGSSANLGVCGIARLCEKIEKTASSELFQQSNIFINRLEQTFVRVRRIFLAERQRRV